MAEVWGAAIAAAGAIGSAYISSQGSKQQAPGTVQYQNVNPQADQTAAIQGNISSLPDIENLLGQSNTFQQQQALKLKNQSLPGYSQLASNLTNQATSLSNDPYKVPQSVVDQLSQYAAENNINEGTGASSGFSQSNLLRSLGVNALQYGQSNMATAMNALSTLSGTAPSTSPMSPLSFLVSPQQQSAIGTNNNTQNQAINQGGANAAAAAANANAANLYDNLTSSVGGNQGAGNLLSTLIGSIGGGGSYGTPGVAPTKPTGGTLIG